MVSKKITAAGAKARVKENKAESTSAGKAAKAPAKSDAHAIYQRLRRDILAGVLAPGEILNTVHLAREHNVSRMPVREALRMLQTEGLVDAPYQHRMRVKAVTAEEVDTVYATWILMQSLAVGLTVPETSPAELEELRQAVQSLNQITPINARSEAAWRKLHMAYSRMVIRHAGSEIIASIENCWLRSERARRAALRTSSASWQASENEHSGILAAFEQGSAAKAVELFSMHLARVALEVIQKIDPQYEPRAIRQALRMTAGRAAAASLGQPAPKRDERASGA